MPFIRKISQLASLGCWVLQGPPKTLFSDQFFTKILAAKKWKIVGGFCMREVNESIQQLQKQSSRRTEQKRFTNGGFLKPQKDWSFKTTDYQIVDYFDKQQGYRLIQNIVVLSTFCRCAKSEDTYAIILQQKPKLGFVVGRLIDLRQLMQEQEKRILQLCQVQLIQSGFRINGKRKKMADRYMDTVMGQVQIVLKRELGALIQTYGEKIIEEIQEQSKQLGGCNYAAVVKEFLNST
eukprot:TRINITY_DN3537_c0_g2_i3.p2 TRINITY_DN3537_c0_g2~~TRINITY_DN3537_c0_g2_i3.p2  ORF type:complete len:236 (-),score=10.76 TRINITY_DN3537_c0_g2_i3:338-1045(-)